MTGVPLLALEPELGASESSVCTQCSLPLPGSSALSHGGEGAAYSWLLLDSLAALLNLPIVACA